MKRTYISVMGTMGSGKTTVARLLAKELHLHLLEENFGENAFLSRFYNDMKRWAFHSQTFFLLEKTNQLLEAGRVLDNPNSKIWNKKTVGIVQDTPIQEDVFSYAKAHHVLGNIDDAEWRLYMKIYQSFEPYFPKPDVILFLETHVPILEERIEKRGRSYEQKIPTSYLELLDMLNHKWLEENRSIPVIRIDTNGLNIVRSKNAQEKMLSRITYSLEKILKKSNK